MKLIGPSESELGHPSHSYLAVSSVEREPITKDLSDDQETSVHDKITAHNLPNDWKTREDYEVISQDFD